MATISFFWQASNLPLTLPCNIPNELDILTIAQIHYMKINSRCCNKLVYFWYNNLCNTGNYNILLLKQNQIAGFVATMYFFSTKSSTVVEFMATVITFIRNTTAIARIIIILCMCYIESSLGLLQLRIGSLIWKAEQLWNPLLGSLVKLLGL